MLAEGDEALRILRDTYDEALLALAAESQGAMEQLLVLTVDYTRERKQFVITSYSIHYTKLYELISTAQAVNELLAHLLLSDP